MEGVTFALSGFQNPKRGDLRSMALEMGAKYRPDWGPGCTHLVCAFKNTPKYKAVLGKGIIVREQWLRDQHAQKRRVRIGRYRMDHGVGGVGDGDTSSSESEASESGVDDETTASPPPKRSRRGSASDDEVWKPPAARDVVVGDDDDDEPDTDDDLQQRNSYEPPDTQLTYGGNTDDDDATDLEDESDAKDGDGQHDGSASAASAGKPSGDLDSLMDKIVVFPYEIADPKRERQLKRTLAFHDGEMRQYMDSVSPLRGRRSPSGTVCQLFASTFLLAC